MRAIEPTRRMVLGLIVLALAAAPGRPSGAASPEGTIETLVRHIIELLESGGLDSEQALERLAETIGGETDLDLLGRLALGRHWRTLGEGERSQYLELFHQLMLRKFAGHLGAYSGQRIENGERVFKITGSRPVGGDDVMVDSVVDPPDRPPIKVRWRLREREGAWLIIDLIVENVSLLISQRSEFASVVEQGGVSALLDQMRSQLARSPS